MPLEDFTLPSGANGLRCEDPPGDADSSQNEPRATVLVVDDEPAVRRVLLMRLQMAGYRVICAEDGEAALELFQREQPDLVVLDVMMPKLDGFAVCRRLRAESCVPIIFLSALDAIAERVAGLDLGADDYLSKPFSPKELEARIATILRRVGRGSATSEPRESTNGSGVLRVGDLVVDTNRRQVSRDSQRIALTYTEFSLLELLFREPGRVVPRAEILEQLWGYPPRRAADLRVVDVYVARLRGKLEPDPRNPELILTVRGTGYASQRVGDPALAAAS
jgi:DNA-binding response OmpR family regulator